MIITHIRFGKPFNQLVQWDGIGLFLVSWMNNCSDWVRAPLKRRRFPCLSRFRDLMQHCKNWVFLWSTDCWTLLISLSQPAAFSSWHWSLVLMLQIYCATWRRANSFWQICWMMRSSSGVIRWSNSEVSCCFQILYVHDDTCRHTHTHTHRCHWLHCITIDS